MKEIPRPAGAIRFRRPKATGLDRISATDLARELVRRASSLETCDPDALGALSVASESWGDVHPNRFSRQRLWDNFYTFFTHWKPAGFDFRGSTILDIGCGGTNPYGFLMVFALLGARRAIGMDVDIPADPKHAVQAAAKAAAYMLLDHKIVVGDYPIERDDVARFAGGFDFKKILAGDATGLDERVCLLHDSVHQMSLADGEVDLMTSNAFLEHVPDLDSAFEEMSRVTSSGGYGAHNIDGIDHKHYADADVAPIGFLSIESKDEIVHGSNRVRPLEYPRLFEKHGFEVVEIYPYRTEEVTADMRRDFLEHYRSMPDEVLSVSQARIYVRKR